MHDQERGRRIICGGSLRSATSDFRPTLAATDHQSNNNYDRSYKYNYLGNRSQITKGGTSTNYIYYANNTSLLFGLEDWAANEMRTYDQLGNLYSDNHNGLDSAFYDYRNLLSWASVQPTDLLVDTSSIMCFDYDENGQRIRKYTYFWYFSEGGGIIYPDPGEAPPGIIINGVTPDGQQLRGYSESHYLYDNDGTLLAIFDQDDNVKQLYINGFMGQEAVYEDNDNQHLYYLIKDHLGSMRVAVDNEGYGYQYINYFPYGEYIESSGSYDEPMKFTGKERDLHAHFDYYYFGARYYDPELGMFSSIDESDRFENIFTPYRYCDNNPILYIDPNGLAWYLMYNSREIEWYDNDFTGPINGEYFAEELYSYETGERIDPKKAKYKIGIIDMDLLKRERDAFIQWYNKYAPELPWYFPFTDDIELITNSILIYEYFANGHPGDLKQRDELNIKGYVYIYYHNMTLRYDALGNILFGIGVKHLNYDYLLMHEAAGMAQRQDNPEGDHGGADSRFMGDNPLDFYYIDVGVLMEMQGYINMSATPNSFPELTRDLIKVPSNGKTDYLRWKNITIRTGIQTLY